MQEKGKGRKERCALCIKRAEWKHSYTQWHNGVKKKHSQFQHALQMSYNPEVR